VAATEFSAWHWLAEIADALKDSRPVGCDPLPLAEMDANGKPVDRLAILHILLVQCSGASIERSRDDE